MSSSLSKIIKNANRSLIASGNLKAVPKYFSPDYSVHLTGKKLVGGHSAVESTPSALLSAFSNIEIKVEVLLEGADRIAWQRTMTAVHSGAFKGFPGSGRKLVWRDMVVSQFNEELIEQEWVSTDLAEQLLLSRKNPKLPGIEGRS